MSRTPATPSGTTLVWGRDNDDGSLDIPAGQSLVLTYQVTVVDASSVSSFTNSAYVDWTSLDEDYPIDPISNPVPGRERTGAGCPTITLPNDYCTGPASRSPSTRLTTPPSSNRFTRIPMPRSFHQHRIRFCASATPSPTI